MNGGAYGKEIKDIFISAEGINRFGHFISLEKKDLNFSYRKSSLAKDIIITEASFKGDTGETSSLQKEMRDIMQKRRDTQPVNQKTGGSTFKNPSHIQAWKLIDQAGCRGLSNGTAQISKLHCNFIINHGGASAHNIESLGEEVRRRVFETSGVTLNWEIERIGEF
jgi:UDP-N-acetylmuramate dehydrogenase